MSGPRVDSNSYYNALPALDHSCGDVWQNLPSFGMLGSATCPGIVITPACDLSWQKSDTLTYLPVVPIRTFFSMDAALPAVMERLMATIQSTGCASQPSWSAKAYVTPHPDELEALILELKTLRSAPKRPAKTLAAVERALAGIHILKCISDEGALPIDASHLSSLFGIEWARIKERIVRNNYSAALHFLPKDNQNLLFSVIPMHSVALFRYPVTVPVRLLTCAQEETDSSWADWLNAANISGHLKDVFHHARPIKMLSLRPAYLSDLLTRFSALYNRIGSPDFTEQTVSIYLSEVDI